MMLFFKTTIFIHFPYELQKYKCGFLYFQASIKRANNAFLKVGSNPELSAGNSLASLNIKNRECHWTSLNCARSQVTQLFSSVTNIFFPH